MENDIYRVLHASPDSSFDEIHKKYIENKDRGLYNKKIIQGCYLRYCKSHIPEMIQFYWEKNKLLIKVLFGLFTAVNPLYLTYLEGFKSNGQFLAVLLSSIYLFCAGWGMEALKWVRFQEINKIPFVGTYIYIILKLGLGICIGGLVVLFRGIRWVIRRQE